MSGYSEESQRLAHQLAEKAARNLRRSGRSVKQDPTSGRYIVGPRKGSVEGDGRASSRGNSLPPTSRSGQYRAVHDIHPNGSTQGE